MFFFYLYGLIITIGYFFFDFGFEDEKKNSYETSRREDARLLSVLVCGLCALCAYCIYTNFV